MELLDSTLREGEQTPGVSFSVEEKVEIAKSLDEFGIDIIEVGHPAVSPDVAKGCKAIVKENLNAETLTHARALKEDIQEAKETGSDWVGIFFGTSPLSLQHKFHMEEAEALETIASAVEYAKSLGFQVRYTPEDATRTEWPYLLKAMEVAEQAGADRISLADTVGTATPWQMGELVSKTIENVSVPVHVHCHNDYGMAVANAMSSYQAGAHLIDVTVNGLGERTGITPLAPAVVALKTLFGVEKDWELGLLPELCHKVEKNSGIFNSEQAPVVGDYAFSHKAGLHTKAVLENPETYEAIPPEIVHKQRQIVIDKYTGKAAVRSRLEEMGITPDEDELSQIVQRVKDKADKSRFTDIDLLEITDEVMDLDLRSRTPSEIEAMVSITLNSTSHTTRVTRKVIAFDEVNQIYELTGESDILAHLRSSSIQGLNDLIEELRNIEGVKTTTTSMVLKDYQYKDD